eukprot:CAMPEP_0201689968 /NCGR_PEP_ID=MMETSP0578-20130828/3498_1 /ASSEMBLY_ACC=CAM_ASM_000663 /TAXON_ID=267565 /ORGANISM="Skeletonema grethea, Strain CCMP 1804" /LENGTH=86 /DNA_ID=CAMNT_0048174807 /DNA_START=18 /DNA_END=278 /DNA_ORIENTATION=+
MVIHHPSTAGKALPMTPQPTQTIGNRSQSMGPVAGFSPIAHLTPSGPPPLTHDFHHHHTHSAEPGSEPFGITEAINVASPASISSI